jgi:GT2 family glycosyltransferase
MRQSSGNAGVRRVAVLMAAHNRLSKTMRSIDRVSSFQTPDVSIAIYLTDDGSTDGTSEAVRSSFPEVQILEGDGNLFWCRSMHLAWRAALPYAFDGYLWLNDDVDLFDGALKRMFDTIEVLERLGPWPAIIVGSTNDPSTGDLTYGGQRRTSTWHPGKLDRVEPDDTRLQLVDTFNGNMVYVPSQVVERIGIIDGTFTHATGDSDYGLRARQAGLPVVLAPGYFGTCRRNPPVTHDLRTIFDRKGLPWRDWLRYTHRHGTHVLWSAAFVGPYLRAAARLVVGGRE